MDTFNKIFRIQCVLLIAFYFLENANCHFVRKPRFRFARDVTPSSVSQNNTMPENSTTVSITDRTEEMKNSNQTGFLKPKDSDSFNSALTNTEDSSTNEPFTTSVPNLKTEEFTTQIFEPSTTVKIENDESSVSTPSSNSTNELFTTSVPNLKSEELTTQFFEPSTTVKIENDESSVSTPSSNSTNELFTTSVPNLKSEEFTSHFFEPSTTVKPSDEESSVSTPNSNHNNSTNEPLTTSVPNFKIEELPADFFEPSTTMNLSDDELSVSTPSSNSTNELFVTTSVPNLKSEEFTTKFFEPSTTVKIENDESSVSTPSSDLTNESFTTSVPNLKSEEFTSHFFEPSTTVKPSDEESSVSTPNSNHNNLTNEAFTTSVPNLKSEEFTSHFFEPSTTVNSSDDELSVSTPSPNYDESTKAERDYFTTDTEKTETTAIPSNETLSDLTPNPKIDGPNIRNETIIRIPLYSSWIQSDVYSSFSKLHPNSDEFDDVEPDDYNEIAANSANETSSVFSSYSAIKPGFVIPSLVVAGGAKFENNSGVVTNAIPVNQTSSISVPASTKIILTKKLSHIYPIPRKTLPSNTPPDFSFEDEMVGSNIKSNIATVSNSSTPTHQTSKTEKSLNSGNQRISNLTEPTTTTEKVLTACLSTIRTPLIDSLSKVVTDILLELLVLFNNALGDSFDEIFNPMMPRLVEEIASSLTGLKMQVNEEINSMVNSTLATIVENKSLALGIINNLQQISINGSKKMNSTVSRVFQKIELLVNEFSSVDTLDLRLFEEAQSKISDLMNRTVIDFSHGVDQLSKGGLDSPIARNLSTDVPYVINDFMCHRWSNFEHIINGSESDNELVNDLTKLTEVYKNNFLNNADSLLVELLINVNEVKGLFDKLLNDILLVLKNLRKNLLEARVNGAKNTKIISDLDDFEKSSLSEIKRDQRFLLLDSRLKSSDACNISRSIENRVRDSIRAVKMNFDDLRNLSSRTENGSVSGTFSLIEIALYRTIYTLQKEVPPVLDIRLLNGSGSLSSLKASALSETFDSILRHYSEQVVVCENAHVAVNDTTNEINFSTSRAIFTYPFEYLLVFAFLFNNLL